MRELDDALEVDAGAVAVADLRDRDERRALVDRGVERLERHDGRVALRHVADREAAVLLRVPDLPDGRELEVGDDDAVAPAVRAQAARDGVHAGRDRGRDGDLVVVGADEAGEARARRLGALHPVLPGRALLVPVAQVVGVGAAHGVGEHALRAAVEVDLVLEQREAMADRVRQRVAAGGGGHHQASSA